MKLNMIFMLEIKEDTVLLYRNGSVLVSWKITDRRFDEFSNCDVVKLDDCDSIWIKREG